jgi:hypothetical protein
MSLRPGGTQMKVATLHHLILQDNIFPALLSHFSHGHTCVMGKYVLMLNMPIKTQE